MAEDSGDKTEDPSGKRLNDAREKGQIARSKELTLFAMLVGSACLIKAYGPAIGQGLLKIMENSFQLNRELIFDPAAPVNALKQAALDAALMLAPFAAILVALALIVPVVLGGWVFSWSALEPKFDRLDPIKGVGRLVSSEGWINLLKSLGSIALIGIVSVVLIRRYLNDLIALDDLPVTQSIENTAAIIEQCYLLLSLSLILVVAIDVPYQLWHYKDQLK
ncbi:MAG: flagellar biosynthetic protein FlhB, partial [Methylobacter sp.]